MAVQPALIVEAYFMDGDIVLIGSMAAFQMEITDLNGDHYAPDGQILVQVFAVNSDNTLPDDPAVMGTATQVEMEGVPRKGMYVFEFDSTQLEAAPPDPNPILGLARAQIPYRDGSVVYQKSFQLKSQSDLS
jgi:hypothetical protein